MKKIIAACIVALSVSQINAQNFDIRLLDKINSPVNTSVDKRWNFFTDLNAPISIATPVTMFITGAVNKDEDLQIKSYETGASILLAQLISSTFKVTVKRERPFETYPDVIFKKAEVNGFSFPSGHTTTAFATATSLSLSFPEWYVIVPSYTYACAMAYSRMYLGVHYPTDILGGIIIGVGATFLVFETKKWLDKK